MHVYAEILHLFQMLSPPVNYTHCYGGHFKLKLTK
jgi:hypothetical protein